MADSARWCAICSCWGNHHTDRHDTFDVMAGLMTADEVGDLRPLPEDVRSHAMMHGWGHGDGRRCMFHARLRMWTPDGLNECLRDHEGFSLPPDALGPPAVSADGAGGERDA